MVQTAPSLLSPLPSSCTRVAFDVGTNTGSDLLWLLGLGFCVVAVDANPSMIRLTANKLAKIEDHKNRVRLLNLGIAATDGNQTMYITPNPAGASLDYAKAAHHSRGNVSNLRIITVPSRPCESLWSYLPAGVRPYYVKIDIEERHYLCVEALLSLPREVLPHYISWEMHEFAHALPYPLLDTQLITRMMPIGYESMKVVSNLAASGWGGTVFSGGNLPEETTDVITNQTAWVPVKNVLARGLGWPRARKWDWWDYHMKLNLTSRERKRPNQPPGMRVEPTPQ